MVANARYIPRDQSRCFRVMDNGKKCRRFIAPGKMACPDHLDESARPPEEQEAMMTYAMSTVLVGGRRREIMSCECGGTMIAGFDHTCDPADRS